VGPWGQPRFGPEPSGVTGRGWAAGGYSPGHATAAP
jgi:hypothetical protein